MKGNEEKNKSKIRQFFLLLVVILLLSGCQRVELSRQLIIAGVGIDVTDDDKVRFTMGLVDTTENPEKVATGVKVYSFEGETIYDAIRNSIVELGKQPIWPYIKIIVIGPSISKEDVTPYLDFFNRNNEVQPNPYIVFSEEEAEKIIKSKVNFSKIPAEIIEEQLNQQKLVSHLPMIKLHQFNEMMLTPDRIGVAAIVKNKIIESKTIPMVHETAVIKDAKWIGRLNSQETRGLLWIRKEVKGGILNIPATDGNGKIGLEIMDGAKVAIEPKIKGTLLRQININVKSSVNIGEMMTQADLGIKETLEIQKLAEKQIKEEINQAIEQAKKLEADIFGFGEVVHRKNPHYWKKNHKEWDEIFLNVPTHISVKVEIKNLGLFSS